MQTKSHDIWMALGIHWNNLESTGMTWNVLEWLLESGGLRQKPWGRVKYCDFLPFLKFFLQLL